MFISFLQSFGYLFAPLLFCTVIHGSGNDVPSTIGVQQKTTNNRTGSTQRKLQRKELILL